MATETLVPDTIVATNNITAAVGDVNTVGGNFAESGPNGNCQLVLGFPTISAGNGSLETGAGLQTFNVSLRRDNRQNNNLAGGNAVDLNITLYLGGTATGVSTNITDITTAFATYTLTWDAATAGVSADGNNVEVGIIQNSGGTGRGTDRRFFQCDYAEWVVEAQDNVAPGKSRAIWI